VLKEARRRHSQGGLEGLFLPVKTMAAGIQDIHGI
jgi:hypothetical protein